MNHSRLRCCCCLLLSLLAGGALVSCGKPKPAAGGGVNLPAALNGNALGPVAGSVYQSETKSPVQWQPWTKESFDKARDAQRLMFVVIAMPQQPDFRRVLGVMERNPAVVEAINSEYVPVLVDGDAAREVGLLTLQLCTEINQAVEMPVFLWMTYEGNPVAWIPVAARSEAELVKLFNQSNEMVRRMWKEDSKYVLKNSALDNDARRKRVLARIESQGNSVDPAADSVQGLRQLLSLYDPFSRTIDEAGGLFPVGVLDALYTGAIAPGVPESLRTRSRETTEELLKDLLPSAMFDPLEGGVFSSRGSSSWALPRFLWNCPDQARVAAALFRAHQVTGNRLALDRAVELLGFAERKFQLEDGLFSVGGFEGGSPESWLWTVDDIEKALPGDQAKEWIAATGMKSLGNLPSDIDPERKWFRANSLSLIRPLEETAEQMKVPAEDFKKRFALSRAKLTEIREERLAGGFRDQTPHAGTSFRMVSAYAAAFAATGEAAYREKAIKLLGLAKAKFSDGRRLSVSGQPGPASLEEARAFIYALAMTAAQDVTDITSGEEFTIWMRDLAGTMAELFAGEGCVQEVSKEAALLDIPITDLEKTFDDTSVGLLSQIQARLSSGGGIPDASLKLLNLRMPVTLTKRPIIYTDQITAGLIQHHAATIISGKELSTEMKNAVERLPLQVIPRRYGKDSDGVPAGSVRVIAPDGSAKVISNPSDLRQEFLIIDKKP